MKTIINCLKNYFELERLAAGENTGEVLFRQPKGPAAGEKESLSALALKAQTCRKCLLHQGRRNLVFGEGSPRAKLFFIGEAPGYAEDLAGQPFVGEAGQLLNKIIAAIGLARSEVYIANVLKCRPPQNRQPLPSEACQCREFLFRQLEIIQPKVICCLGKVAANTLLGEEAPISALRNKEFFWRRIKVIPTFHPAYLLRNPQDKHLVWQDMKKVKKEL
jgi:DNA polymerase